MQENSKINHILFNDFFGNGTDLEIEEVDSLGILIQTNTNGDSCDANYNIFLDPNLVNPSEKDLTLEINSPCVNAGNPFALYNDMDGTINNMGGYGGTMVFSFPNPSLLEFDPIVVGEERRRTLKLANNRKTPFTIKELLLSNDVDFSFETDSLFVLKPYLNPTINQHEKNVNLLFHPKKEGQFNEELRIISDDYVAAEPAVVILKAVGESGTIVEQGNVSGRWSKVNSPYIINGSITINQRDTLYIEAGVEVRFNNSSGLSADGILHFEGSKTDSINFRPNSGTTRWNGIHVSTPQTLSVFKYCLFDRIDIMINQGNLELNNCKVASAKIRVTDGRLLLNGCLLEKSQNTTLRCTNSDVKLTETTLRNQYVFSGPIYAGAISANNCKIILSRCKILNNRAFKGAGIYLHNSNASLDNSIFAENLIIGGYGDGAAIYAINSRVNMENVTIYRERKIVPLRPEITLDGSSHLFMTNSIIWSNNNTPLISFSTTDSDTLTTAFGNVKGGVEGEGNIDVDPLFVDAENGDFILKANSLCTDAGNPDPQFNDIEEPNNPGFALFPSQGTVRNDMGAYGGPGARDTVVTSVATWPTEATPNDFHLLQNYPNPFNPGTTIRYELPHAADVKIEIYNLLGQRVITLVDKNQSAGAYSLQWDGKDRSGKPVGSGVYLYRLQTNDFTKVLKLTLLK